MTEPICRVCGGRDLKLLPRASYYVSKPSQVSLYRCATCHTVSSDDRAPRYDDLYYDRCEAFTPGTDENQTRNALFRARAQYFSEHVGLGCILDVGCARGDFLDHAQALGYETYGLEISRAAAAVAIQRGHRVVNASAEQLPFAPNSFVAVHMNHVLEHVEHPLVALKSIHDLLVPAGIAIVEVPNELGPLAVRLKLRFGQLGTPGSERIHYAPHLTYFTMRSLRALVCASGLRVVRERIRFYSPITPMLHTLPAQVARVYDRLTQNGDLVEITLTKTTEMG